LFADSGILPAFGPPLRVEHVILNPKLNTISSPIELDDSCRRIEKKIDPSCYHVALNGRGRSLAAVAPIEETQPQDKLKNFTLLADLGMETKQLRIYRLNALAA
jgi:hypothetical protein